MFDLLRHLRRPARDQYAVSNGSPRGSSRSRVRRGQGLVEFGRAVGVNEKRSRVRRGQGLVEFGMVFMFLTMLMVGGTAVMITLFQPWSDERSVNELGTNMAVSGEYNSDIRDDFLARGAELGFIPNPDTDTLTITVTKEEGPGECGVPTCVYGWDDTVSMNYGDMVSVRIVSPIQFPAFLGWMNDLLGDPQVAASWTGISQRNGGDATTNPHPSTSGALRGTVRSAATGEPLADVILTLDTGESAVTDSEGNYSFPTVPTGAHTVQASKAGFQNAIVDVTVPPNTTVTLDFQLVGLARLMTMVLQSDGANLMSDADLEAGTEWSGTGTSFTSSTTVTHTAAAASADDYGMRINSTSGGSPNQGAVATVSGTFSPTETYVAFAWVRAPEGISVDVILGANGGNHGERTYVGDGQWMPMWAVWEPDSSTNDPFFVIRTSGSSSINAIIDFDELIVANVTEAELGATVTTEDGLLASEREYGLYELAMDSSGPHIVRATNADGDRTGGQPISLVGDSAAALIVQMDVDAVPSWVELLTGDLDLLHWWRLGEGAGAGSAYANRVLDDDPVAYWRLDETDIPSETNYGAVVAADNPVHYWPLDDETDNYEQALYEQTPTNYFPMDGSGSSATDIVGGTVLSGSLTTAGAPGAAWDNGIIFDTTGYADTVRSYSSLRGYWPLSDNAGVAYDRSLVANNNCVPYGSGMSWRAGELHAQSDASIDFATNGLDCSSFNSAFETTGDLTLSWFMRPDNVAAARQNPVGDNHRDTLTVTQETNGQLNFYWPDSSSDDYFPITALAAGSIVDGGTYHITFTRDVSARTWRIYVNGSLANSGTWTATEDPTLGTEQHDFRIGTGYVGDYQGRISDVAIFHSAFNNTQASNLYAARTASFAYMDDTTPSNLPTGSSPRTTNLWYRGDSTQYEQVTLFSYGTPVTRGIWGLSINWTGERRLGIYVSGEDCIMGSEFVGLNNGEWHMLTSTYDGGTDMDLYIDGTHVLDCNLTAPLNTAYNANGLVIGRNVSNGDRQADNVWMDDLAFWDTEFSAGEVADLYDAASASTRRTIDTSSGLVGYWGLDEPTNTSCTTMRSVQPGAGGLMCGSPTVNQAPLTAMGDSSIYFDGVDDEVDITFTGGFTEATAAAWVQPRDVGVDQMIMTFGNNGNYLRIVGGDPFVSMRVNGVQHTVAGPDNLENGQTYHIAATFDGSVIRLYVDGEEVGSTSVSGSLSVATCLTGFGQPCQIGRWIDSDQRSFTGYIDEVALWSRGLNSSEIDAIYDAGHQVFADAAGNADMLSRGRIDDRVAALDRIGDSSDAARFYTAGASAELGGLDAELGGNNPYTFEAWINPDNLPTTGGTSDWQRIMGTETAGSSRTGHSLVLDNDGDIYFERWNVGSNVGTAIATIGANSVDQWVHVVGTYDGATMKLYLNGSLAASTAAPSPVNDLLNNPITIGARTPDPREYVFDGAIDEAAIYDRALGADEVFEHYTVGLDTIAAEVGVDGHVDGVTASADVPFTSGGNAALDFDGASDRALGFIPELTDSSEMTIEWWGRWDSFTNNDDFWFELGANTNQLTGAAYIDPNASSGDFRVVLRCNSGTNKWYTTARPTTAWTHYAVTFDLTQPSGDEVEIYFNGVAQTLGENGSCDTSGTLGANTLHMMHRGGNKSLFGDGALDEVAIYDTALSSSDILAHYASASGVGFDDSEGAADSGFATGVTPGVTGAIVDDDDTAFDFAGSGTGQATLPTEIEEVFTVEAWANPANTNAGTYTIVSGRTDNEEHAFSLSLVGGNTVRATIADADGWMDATADVNFSYSAGTWHHIVVAVTNTGWDIFVDGVHQGGGNHSGTPVLSPDMVWTIGANGCTPTCSSSEAFIGVIDEVEIYDRAFEESDAAIHYLVGIGEGE